VHTQTYTYTHRVLLCIKENVLIDETLKWYLLYLHKPNSREKEVLEQSGRMEVEGHGFSKAKVPCYVEGS
jgi:hypothetical protein